MWICCEAGLTGGNGLGSCPRMSAAGARWTAPASPRCLDSHASSLTHVSSSQSLDSDNLQQLGERLRLTYGPVETTFRLDWQSLWSGSHDGSRAGTEQLGLPRLTPQALFHWVVSPKSQALAAL
jgi:hypothetical protein